MLSIFKPKWKKQSHLVLKGSEKYVNYRRDILAEQKLAEIEFEMDALKSSVKANDKESAKKQVESLTKLCNFSAGMSGTDASLAENTEVIFVAIAIALALRAYVVQPFRIPTGSMQPTLNGIRGEVVEKDQWPGVFGRGFEMIANGRSYNEYILPEDDVLTGINENTFLFFTRTTLSFEKAGDVSFSGSASSVVNGMGLGDNLQPYLAEAIRKSMGDRRKRLESLQRIKSDTNNSSYYVNAFSDKGPFGPIGLKIPGGTKLITGYSQSGDLILVNKVSYHFRKPERGEVFVFDTRDIQGTLGQNADELVKRGRQAGGEHYIKRLVGVPGDSLEIKPSSEDGVDGTLYVNGELAKGVGFDKVHSGDGEYSGYFPIARLAPGGTATLNKADDPAFDEYFPLGDNSRNSLDGRYWKVMGKWEAVHGYNIVGPAWFSLWPITDHWGIIK